MIYLYFGPPGATLYERLPQSASSGEHSGGWVPVAVRTPVPVVEAGAAGTGEAFAPGPFESDPRLAVYKALIRPKEEAATFTSVV
jgi:hypothetical protein